jgi:hypothetical protein
MPIPLFIMALISSLLLVLVGGSLFLFPEVARSALGLVFNPVQHPIFRGYLSHIIGRALDFVE